MKMSKLTAAYIAGFVDGEGHISIYPYVRKDRDNQVYYKSTLKVSNTNKEIIEWLKSSFGGWIYTQNKDHLNQKTLYTWSLDAKNAELVLKTIYPYLRIKRKQCELVLERIRIGHKRRIGSKSSDRGVSYCKDTGKWRSYIYQDGKQVNLGVYDTKNEALEKYAEELNKINSNFLPYEPKDDERVIEIYKELRMLNKRGTSLYVERLNEMTS